MRPIEDIADERSERRDAIEHVGKILREYFREGSADVRLVISNVPRGDWHEIAGEHVRRYPDGDVKIERLGIGISVEFVPRPMEPREAHVIPIARGAA